MTILLWAIIIIVLAIVLLKVVSTILSLGFGSVSGESPNEIIKKALKLADLKPGEKLYDLGSSNGRVLRIASRDFSAKATGFEISPFPYFISKINCTGQKNIKIRFQNALNANLSKADVIYCYLLPGLLEKLSKKFARELKPGTRIISYAFKIPNLKPIKTIKTKKEKIYLYKI